MSILMQTSAAAEKVAAATTQLAADPASASWDAKTWGVVILAAGVAILIFAYGGVRFWLMSTRPPAIPDVHTPTLDRLNQEALSHMTGEEVETVTSDEPPADLLAAVPDEEEPGTHLKHGDKKNAPKA